MIIGNSPISQDGNGKLAAFTEFSKSCEQFLDTKLNDNKLTTLEKKLIGNTFSNVVTFINSNNLAAGARQISSDLSINKGFGDSTGCESFNDSLSFNQIGGSELFDLCEQCRIPNRFMRPAVEALALLMYRLSNGVESYYTQQFSPAAQSVGVNLQLNDLHNIIPHSLHAEVFDAVGVEAFGADTDKTVPDIRVAMTITLLKFHRGLLNRIMHRRTTPQPVVTYVVPWGEAYDTQKSMDPSGKVRESQTYRKPMIDLYADPSMVTNSLRRIDVLKDNDTENVLVADNIIKFNYQVNLMDLSRIPDQIGFTQTDYTDLIADGVLLEKIYVRCTKGGTTEDFVFNVREYSSARLLRQNNTKDSGDRSTIFNQKFLLFKDLIPVGGTTASTLFSTLTATACIGIDISCSPICSVKWGRVKATGGVILSAYAPDETTVPAAVTTAMTDLSVTLLGYTLDAKFSEENLRKTNIALRAHVFTKQWEIPVGRNYVVDYALQQSVPEFTMGMMTEAISLGQDDRALKIIGSTLTDVYDRLKLENSDPRFREQLDRIGFEYIAAQHVNPYVVLVNMDLNNVDSIRSSDILGDIRQYVDLTLLNVFSLLHQNSYYKSQLNDGEKPTYKVITSSVILENIFNIPHIHNHIEAQGNGAADGSTIEYTRVLPNGTILQCVSCTYNSMRDKIIIIPFREGDPESFLNAGHNWDFGTYLAHYNPQLGGGVNKRMFANARELPIITNPIGAVIDVSNISKIIDVYATLSYIPTPAQLELPSEG